MPTHVYANNNEIASKACDGKSIAAFPDVCFSPPAPPVGPMPLPYPNTGECTNTDKGTSKVFIKDKMVGMEGDSCFSKSMGDEAATQNFNKGMITGALQGKCYFGLWSMDVQMEGKNVPRHLDMVTHNHASQAGAVSNSKTSTYALGGGEDGENVLINKSGNRGIYIKVGRGVAARVEPEFEKTYTHFISRADSSGKSTTCDQCIQIVNATDAGGNPCENSIFDLKENIGIEQHFDKNSIPRDGLLTQAMFSRAVGVMVEICSSDDIKGPFNFKIKLDFKKNFENKNVMLNKDSDENKIVINIIKNKCFTKIIEIEIDSSSCSKSIDFDCVTDSDGVAEFELILSSLGSIEYKLFVEHSFESDDTEYRITDAMKFCPVRLVMLRAAMDDSLMSSTKDINFFMEQISLASTMLRTYGVYTFLHGTCATIMVNKTPKDGVFKFSISDDEFLAKKNPCIDIAILKNFEEYGIFSIFPDIPSNVLGFTQQRELHNQNIEGTMIVQAYKTIESPKNYGAASTEYMKVKSIIFTTIVHEFLHIFGIFPTDSFKQFVVTNESPGSGSQVNFPGVEEKGLRCHCLRIRRDLKGEGIEKCIMAPTHGGNSLCNTCQSMLKAIKMFSLNTDRAVLDRLLA